MLNVCVRGVASRQVKFAVVMAVLLFVGARPRRVDAQSFNAVTPFPTHEHPNSIAWGDFNRDGILDMAVPQYEVGLTVYLGDGSGAFVEEVTYTCGTSRASVARDFNGDGLLDVAVTSEKGNAVLLFTGNGHGGFAPFTSFPVGLKPYFLSGGDFNSDGHPDIAVANSSSGTISVLLGDGAGHFAPQTQYTVGTTPRSVVSADFNSDGKPDLAVANFDSNSVSVLLGNDAGAFGAAVDVATASGPYLIAAADLNGDGLADLVVPNFKGGTVSILLGDGAAHFVTSATIPTGASPRHAAVADLNADGRPDLVISNRDASSISILLGTGGGAFAVPETIGVGAGPFFTAIADVDADGHADLATVNRDAHTISIMKGDGTGFYQGPFPLIAGRGPRGMAAADFNGDGRLDLALPNYYSNTVTVLRGTGSGRALSTASYAVSRSPWAVAAADFNGDGHPDLAVTNASANNVSVLVNDGTGTFAAARNYAAGPGPVAILAADLNGDSIVDLATANSGGASVSVLLGNGLGGFAPAVQWTVGSMPNALVSADLDRDGLLDLVVSNNNSNTVSVLLGNGSGGFVAGGSLVVGASPAGVAVADLTGDGPLDLAVTSSTNNTVQILRGDGTGAFTLAGSSPVGATPLGVVCGDLDGDGVLDLATADAGANAVSVLRGLGNGIFAPEKRLIAGLYPRVVVIGEFTGDGHPDIAAANANSDDAWILVNTTGQADLAVSIDDGRSLISLGEGTSYSVVVTNHGPADAPAVAVSVQLPAGTANVAWSCTPGAGAVCGVGGAGALNDLAFVPAGANLVYTVSGTIAPDATGTITATAGVANNGGVDANPANNNASDADTVGSNHAPVAANGQATIPEDGSVSITLNATDQDGHALGWSVVTGPAHGTLAGTAPNLVYEPGANFNGTDTFTFQANDGQANSNMATVTISVTPVNDPPVALSQSVTATEDTPLAITVAGSDPDGDALTFAVATAPSHGSLSGTAPGLIYTPAAGYTGADTFRFTVSDGEVASTPATISIAVSPVNHPPVVSQPIPDVSVADESTQVVLSLSGTFSDPDSGAGDVFALSVSANSNPSLVTPSFSGTSLNLSLAAGASGTSTIRVRATDSHGSYGEDDFTVTVIRPPLNVSVADASVIEGNSGTRSLIFSLTLSAVSTGTVSVPFSVTGFTAQAGVDFTAVSGTIIFNPGVTARTISVPIIPDLIDEDDETLHALLGTVTGAQVSRGEGIGTIVDDDTSALSISDVTVTEGNSGTVQAVFQVSLSRANSRTVTVDYATGDSTAFAGLDYQANSGSLTFVPGVQSQTAIVSVVGDTIDEANEGFTVTLGSATNTGIAHGVGYGTIADDDDPPTVSISDTTVTEGNTAVVATFTVSLSAPSGLTTRVKFATSDGTAIAGTDYRALTGTVTFAPGTTTATVSVTILGDKLAEPSETLFVTLNTPTLLTIGSAQATATIVDDDTPSP